VHSKSTGSVPASLIGKEGLGDWKHAIERIREDDYVIRINFKPTAANHLCPGRVPPYYAPGLMCCRRYRHQSERAVASYILYPLIRCLVCPFLRKNTSSIQAS
jgi:hypothetical protein